MPPLTLESQIVLVGVRVLQIRVEKTIALVKGSGRRRNGARAHHQWIGCFRIYQRNIEIATGKIGCIWPTLREIGSKPDHRCPVIKESAIGRPEHRLVVDAVGYAEARLNVVIRVLYDFSVG